MPPPPPKKKKLHNRCLSFLLGIAAVPREIENNAYAKFGGSGGGRVANKVHYGRCASGVFPNCKTLTFKTGLSVKTFL